MWARSWRGAGLALETKSATICTNMPQLIYTNKQQVETSARTPHLMLYSQRPMWSSVAPSFNPPFSAASNPCSSPLSFFLPSLVVWPAASVDKTGTTKPAVRSSCGALSISAMLRPILMAISLEAMAAVSSRPFLQRSDHAFGLCKKLYLTCNLFVREEQCSWMRPLRHELKNRTPNATN